MPLPAWFDSEFNGWDSGFAEGGIPEIARLDPDTDIQENQTLELYFNPNKLHCFDADRGSRIPLTFGYD